MTESTRPPVTLTRPAPAARPGPLDDTFYDLVEARLRRVLRDNPIVSTYIGLHTDDGRLGDGSHDRQLQELADDRAHLTAVEALDGASLSPEAAFERELEAHNLRRSLFDAEVVRTWERRSTAMDTVGDGLFLLFARDFAPLPERLASIAGRLEGVPAFLDQSRSRAVLPQVRLWQQLELESAETVPSLFDEVVAAGSGVQSEADQRRLERAAAAAKVAVDEYSSWLRQSLPDGVDEWALGRERFDQLVALRAFDGLDADDILEVGWQQLAEHQEARIQAAREIDPSVDEPTVIARLKEDHPATFEEALDAYRDVMIRSRTYLIEHDIVTVPPDERIAVIETPTYLANVIPFAAYFDPPKFDRDPSGIYIVTRSVGDNENGMREHNFSSISNTSIHEAYPGHHLQLSVAGKHPSLTRLAVDAPEFTEGWGMYSEQMMREQGFDDAPNFRLNMHTDAIWRACRIILDVRMHRGEIGVDEAVRWMVEQTSFEEPNARAEIHRYTYTPTYQLSYLLGKVLLLQLRADEQRRLGPEFRLRDFHDALLRAGSLPISFQRRLLEGTAGGGAPARRSSGPAGGGPGATDIAAKA